jgi:hypothetical protein
VFVKGETVPAVAATFSPPLAYDPRWAGPTLAHERRAAIERLAQRLAHGGFVRLVCVFYPRQCHATSIAKLVRRRAESIFAAPLGEAQLVG